MPTDYTSFFQSWNLKHVNIYFWPKQTFGWKLCWSSLCDSNRVTMQSAQQWQEQILYLLELSNIH